MSTYFEPQVLSKCFQKVFLQHRIALAARRNRPQIVGFRQNPTYALCFKAGDILKYAFEHGPTTYFFEGLCLSLRSRRFGRKQTTFMTRNVITSVGVEILIAYFIRRLYKLSFSDYKRKQFFYNKARLYFLRGRINRESRVR